MDGDLKYLKKHYGERFAHLCRSLFPTILEQEGLLTNIISSSFAHSRLLYDDIINEDIVANFRSFVYKKAFGTSGQEQIVTSDKTPEELLKEQGYILYPEIKTNEELQAFAKYYTRDEQLCSFHDEMRLNSTRVWFAVKQDVDQIKREDFLYPHRQDRYGTSVISIQFSKDDDCYLSIKNRYNHTVDNPDATFSNNLDNIVPGLTDAFSREYGLQQCNAQKNVDFNIPGYVTADDGRMYRENLELLDTSYCDNNNIIRNGQIIQYDKGMYILVENYLIDLSKRTIVNCINNAPDSFTKSIGEIKDIKVTKNSLGREITFIPKDGFDVKLVIDNHNQIVSYTNENVKVIEDDFLSSNVNMRELYLPNVKKIGDNFLTENKYLTKFNLNNVTQIGDSFLQNNLSLENIALPNLVLAGDKFMAFSYATINSIYLPKLSFIGANSLMCLHAREVNLPSLKTMGANFLFNDYELTKLVIPNVKRVPGNCFTFCRKLKDISANSLEVIGGNSFYAVPSEMEAKIKQIIQRNYISENSK